MNKANEYDNPVQYRKILNRVIKRDEPTGIFLMRTTGMLEVTHAMAIDLLKELDEN